MNFRISVNPPTVTSQEKGVFVRNGKPIFYTKDEVKRAKQLFTWYLYKNRPEQPFKGAVMLKTVWTFPITGKHKDGEYKTTKPDTDNLVKLFKDCMTKVGFWQDDAQVAYEVTVKQYGGNPGIDVSVNEI